MNAPSPSTKREARARMTHALQEKRTRWWENDETTARPVAVTVAHHASPRSGREVKGSFWDRLDARRNLFALLCLCILGTTMGIVSRSKIAKIKWQRTHATAQAEKLIANFEVHAGDLEVFSRACKESPDKPHLLRALAKACAAENPSQARRCYNRIAELGATTLEDDACHAVLLAKLKDFTGARAVIANAQRTSPDNVSLLLAALSVAREELDFSTAASTLDHLAKIKPASMDECLETAEAAARAGALPAIMARLENHTLNAFGLCATMQNLKALGSRAERLTRLPMREPASRSRALQILQCLENAPVEQRLAVVLFAHTCAGSGREETIRACQENMHRTGGLSAEEKDRVAALLQRRGEHAMVTELITLPESFIERPLFERRLQSVLNLGQWKEASTMVGDARAPAPVRSRTLTRALTTLKTMQAGNPIASDLLADSLKEAATEASAPACFTIGCIALDQHFRLIAEEAFSIAANLSGDNDTIVEGIVNNARRSGMSVTDVLHILTQATNAQKFNPSLQAKLCYLRLLVKNDPEETKAYLAAQMQYSPDDAYVHFLAALDLYHKGDFGGALKLLVPLPQHRWHQGEAAVIATMIATAGQPERSADLIKTMDFAKLFPEERALIEPWRMKLSLAPILPAFVGAPGLQASNP